MQVGLRKFFWKFENYLGFFKFFVMGGGKFLTGKKIKEVEGLYIREIELVSLLEDVGNIFHENYNR